MRAALSESLPRREGGVMSALGKLVRTTAFKLLLAYLLVFTVFAFATLGYVAWSARRVLDAQFVSTIDAEINGLREQFGGPGGLRRLVATVERRSRMPGASLYLVTTPAGERVAGNIGALPPGVLDRPGQFETNYGRTDDDPDATPNRAIVRVYLLPAGFRLLVGRDVEERSRLREAIQNAFGSSLILVGASRRRRRLVHHAPRAEARRRHDGDDPYHHGGRSRRTAARRRHGRRARSPGSEPQCHARPYRRADDRPARRCRTTSPTISRPH